MEKLGEDPDLRAVVVAAKGPAFTVGLDLKSSAPVIATGSLDPAAPPPGSPVAHRARTRQLIKAMQHTFSSLAQCPVPVIAAIHGYCIGAGVDLITACDIRYAAADAVFSIRETAWPWSPTSEHCSAFHGSSIPAASPSWPTPVATSTPARPLHWD